ncbi:hypothetical protein [Psychrobacter sp. I-STPA10]|uniref:hypothetical protein n=1 Tax=Psychrobacter sp. I-STPA10 TaxID=2585769 RepID=UPI001E32D5DB|nr:hypothetical protein [Psychrobacter sp. I-STPA10]
MNETGWTGFVLIMSSLAIMVIFGIIAALCRAFNVDSKKTDPFFKVIGIISILILLVGSGYCYRLF